MEETITSGSATTTNPFELASIQAFGDLTDAEWAEIGNAILPQLPPLVDEQLVPQPPPPSKRKRVRSTTSHPVRTTGLQSGVHVAAAPIARKRSRPKAPSKAPPRSHSRTHAVVHPHPPSTPARAHPLPHSELPPPIPRKPKTHSSKRKLDCAPPSFPISSDALILPSSTLTSSFSVDDALSYILDAYDSIISPLIPPPANPTPACHALRRALYRKLFSTESLKLIHLLGHPITSLDELIPIIQTACAKSNLLFA